MYDMIGCALVSPWLRILALTCFSFIPKFMKILDFNFMLKL